MAALSRVRAPAAISHSITTRVPRRCTSSLAPRIIKYEPGLVLFKSALAFGAETMLALAAMQKGKVPENGFYRKDKDGKTMVLNSRPYRGRMYCAVDQFEPDLTPLCKKILEQAAEHDPELKVVEPTHLIALIYKTLDNPPPEGYMPWHRDNGDNDGIDKAPVISISVGDSCDFLVCHEKPKISQDRPIINPVNLAHRILFESGDVLIFGGASRNIYHAIYQIHPNTSPDLALIKGGRLNFTLRYTPNLKGREKEFATVPAEQLAKDSPFYKLSKM